MIRYSKQKLEIAKKVDELVKDIGKIGDMNLHVEGPYLGYIVDGGFPILVTTYDSCYFKIAVDGKIPIYETEDEAQLANCQEMEKLNTGFCAECLKEKESCLLQTHFDKELKPLELGWEEDAKVS